MAEWIQEGAVKVIEIIGISEKSFDAAVAQAVEKASQTIKGITGIEVMNLSARVSDGKVVQYKADVKLAFAVKQGLDRGPSGPPRSQRDARSQICITRPEGRADGPPPVVVVYSVDVYRNVAVEPPSRRSMSRHARL